MSTALDEDAGLAYHRFRHEARRLGAISGSLRAVTHAATAEYHAALTQSTSATWAALVRETAALVRTAHTLDGIVPLDDAEREALAFFEAIVRENADLLPLPAAVAPQPAWMLARGAAAS